VRALSYPPGVPKPFHRLEGLVSTKQIVAFMGGGKMFSSYRRGLYLGMLCIWWASGAVAQQTETNTIVGCLNRADRRGFYSLREEGTGFLITVTGPEELDRYSANNEVRLTGSIVREQGEDVFRVANMERLATTCAAQLNPEGFRRAVGRAIFGIRGGVGFDPELIYMGAHAQVGPLISNVWLRPNYEFGFGEVTKINSFALDLVYFLPVVAREGRNPDNVWNFYVGAGPAYHLRRQSFDQEDFESIEGEEAFDFGDWDSDGGLNFFFGMAGTSGLFTELKGGAYGSPSVKLLVGYSFR
jgi:hypothetical protein